MNERSNRFVPPPTYALRQRPRFPSELTILEPEEYRELLAKSGYSKEFIEDELKSLSDFQTREAGPSLPPVTEGPVLTPQYESWSRMRRRRKGHGTTEKA